MSQDIQRGLTAALFEAAAAAMRDEPPEEVLRALGERIRALGLARPAAAATRRLAASSATSGSTALVPAAAPQAALELAPAEPPPAERRPDPYREQVIEVFVHWREKTGHASAKLTPDRIQKVRARLREGYTVSDLRRAIDGCVGSPFHSGENERATRYDDLTLICRTGSKVEYFREMAAAENDYTTPVPARKSNEELAREDEIRKLRDQATKLLKEGKTEEYAHAIRSIRELGK